MNLAGTEFNLETKSLDIFVSGCNLKCKGCFNPEAQDFNFGETLNIDMLIEKIKTNHYLISSIRVMGGDLLSQDESEAINFINNLKFSFPSKTLTLYTGENFDSIPEWCFDKFDAIKYGPFIEELKCEHPLYGSSNQGYWIKEEYF